jgi:peptidoglycan/LPS O-acetylase OafA/YrhL
MFEIYGFDLSDVGDGSGGLGASFVHQVIVLLYDWIFRLGGLAVPVFIVISGFSLMIPVARSPEALHGARRLVTFFYRRARRIVPPYYAALALSLIIILLVPSMGESTGRYWDRAVRDLDWANIGAHLLLVHNLSPAWNDAINPPLWSLAVEWQIYFLFPLLVIMWRRLGMLVLLAATAIYGIAPIYLEITVLPFSHTHFVLLFAMGMAGAAISFAQTGFEAQLRERLPWGLLAALGFAAFAALHVARRGFNLPVPDGWAPTLVIGGAVVALMIHCAKSQLEGAVSVVERALSHPTLTWLGAFSYSLYLVHLPVLALLAALAVGLALPVTLAYLLVFVVGLPLALAAGYGFYILFEQPFLNAPPRPRVEASPARGNL